MPVCVCVCGNGGRRHCSREILSSLTYPGMEIDEGMRNSGFRLESRQHPFAKLSRLLPEHHVPGESVTGQQAPHETNVRFEQRYLRVLEEENRARSY